MNLNLARKWRSKNFDTIAGQELSIKMLKNSLYLGQFFPVYLFAGQRGCGKTTTARVFAAAVNCEQLPAFQKNPKTHAVPCLKCASCLAMAKGQHPDFIEMDAASHTGVDDVRAIVEAASLLPVMGYKKVYLIDEAHMLSKAAFNALLKILEEPPHSVLFILATTDPHKIIDTVLSRCFQLSFKAVQQQPLLAHLSAVCSAEQIRYAPGGLEAIIQATEGSVRDALNMIEQVRFSSGTITPEAVHALLGQVSDEDALRLFELVLHKGPKEVLSFLQEHKIHGFSAQSMWRTLTELVRAAIWVRHGVEPQAFAEFQPQLQQLVMRVSASRLQSLAQLLYEHEQLFMRTTAQYELIELLLLRMCKPSSDESSGAAGAPSSLQAVDAGAERAGQDVSDEDAEEEPDDNEDDTQDNIEDSGSCAPWNLFLADMGQLNDPLLSSLFTQGTFVAYHADTETVEIQFSKELVFFKDWLDDAQKSWLPLLRKQFGAAAHFLPVFTGTTTTPVKKTPAAISGVSCESANTVSAKVTTQSESVCAATKKTSACGGKAVGWAGQQQGSAWQGQRGFSRQQRATGSRMPMSRQKPEHILDIHDAQVWKKATMLLHYFPGTITEIEERVEGHS